MGGIFDDGIDKMVSPKIGDATSDKLSVSRNRQRTFEPFDDRLFPQNSKPMKAPVVCAIRRFRASVCRRRILASTCLACRIHPR